jgi:hypothetical protein
MRRKIAERHKKTIARSAIKKRKNSHNRERKKSRINLPP